MGIAESALSWDSGTLKMAVLRSKEMASIWECMDVMIGIYQMEMDVQPKGWYNQGILVQEAVLLHRMYVTRPPI